MDSDSTEDMLSAIEAANKKLESAPMKEGDLSVFSMDAEALFPSLALPDILKGVWDLIMDGDVPFNNINWREMTKYLAVLYTEKELREHKVISTIPKRQTVLDGTDKRAPTMAFLDSNTYTRTRNGVKEPGVEKWNWDTVKNPSPAQRKRIVALTLMKAVETLLPNQIYLFDN